MYLDSYTSMAEIILLSVMSHYYRLNESMGIWGVDQWGLGVSSALQVPLIPVCHSK